MSDTIINRVSSSKLVTFDLEEYYVNGNRYILDIKDWLHQGIVLKEKEFRAYVEQHNWQDYRDGHVALNCSADAIIPGWAYMLLAIKLAPYAITIVQGDMENLEAVLYQKSLEEIDYSIFQNCPVIIKGCSKKPVPKNAYIWAAQKLIGVASSVMYGEACSSVPLYKKK